MRCNAGSIRAALDVTDPEPLPTVTRCGSARICLSRRTWRVKPEFAPRALRVAADELRRYMAGEPLHNVVQAAV